MSVYMHEISIYLSIYLPIHIYIYIHICSMVFVQKGAQLPNI